MSRGINKVILVGNLGDDPKVRQGNAGNFVTFSLATSSSYKDADGQEQSNTEWHDLVAYKRISEIIAQYLTKGSKVYIEGSLRTRHWKDPQTGQAHSKTNIVVREMQMLDSKGGGGQSYNKLASKQSYGEGNRERPPWEQ